MITIYHKPQCSKSREGVQLLENLGIPFEIVKYLDQPLSKEELKELIKKLGIKPIELVRTKEDLWKEKYAGRKLTGTQVIAALAKYPNLMERPIVVNGEKAIIARPSEKVKEIL
ncbi:arsenate reductase (glutaredoxin) [Flavobacterium sp. MFBS3-15]|uniref:arsenate reductase (glutaredoxin) n=1 Tax=Flavobacterium sp. MFBS3-15 TaxID=2989816 RepID=UPI0022360477|nr:arsenate reductase (glutaredoxin) [Flavobacterium sp. MFBS3-15]MCW4469933.1 arsenate reductase (glutaredoxin) [Flavobacterium sp. MFBS3-15]